MMVSSGLCFVGALPGLWLARLCRHLDRRTHAVVGAQRQMLPLIALSISASVGLAFSPARRWPP